MTTLFGDLETYSETDLRTCGTYKYAENAEVMLFAYAFDDQPAVVWDLTEQPEMPFELAEFFTFLSDDDVIVFQNAMFDRSVLRLGKNLRIEAPIHLWRDTMVKGLAHSLPGGLEKQGEILGAPEDARKAKIGKQLIQLFCKPRPAHMTLRRATRLTHPAEWQQFKEYARLDVEAMRANDRKLPSWNYQGDELALWHLDQKINDRGVCIDLDLAHAAIETVEREQKSLARRTVTLTNGDVESTTKRDKLLAYLLEEHGVELPDLRADTIERRLNDTNLPRMLRELLAIRLQATTTSTTKYKALARGTSADGRLRGLLQFDGAQRTGRWAGRFFQPQNLKRPDMPQEAIDLGIRAIKAGAADLLFDNVMRVAANAMRGSIIAPLGKKLVVSDLSNIEGRGAAFLAQEAWKLKAFADFDAGIGTDLYIMAYARAFNVDPKSIDKKTPEGSAKRQIGKVMELMLGYEGGVGAFITGAATYGIDLDAMAEAAWPTIPGDVLDEARGFWAWTLKKKRSTFGLTEKTFMVCDALKRLWRRAHPQISSMWGDLAEATRSAIAEPGKTFPCRTLRVRRDGAWLRIGLPSGRCLCYPAPQVADDGQISYMGVNQYSRKWERIKTYSGRLFENVTQAFARDVMAANMPAIEAAGFEIVLTCHDEIITEVLATDALGSEHLNALLASTPSWAQGLPLAAGGYEGPRYKKD